MESMAWDGMVQPTIRATDRGMALPDEGSWERDRSSLCEGSEAQ